jgi:hypothetical protein
MTTLAEALQDALDIFGPEPGEKHLAPKWETRAREALAAHDAQQKTTGHCHYKKQPGGCHLHNLECGYPACDQEPPVPEGQHPVQRGSIQGTRHDAADRASKLGLHRDDGRHECRLEAHGRRVLPGPLRGHGRRAARELHGQCAEYLNRGKIQMKSGIAIDDWKLPIFERHLTQAGYAFENLGELTKGILLLTIETDNQTALAGVVVAANEEAHKTGKPTP